MNNTSKKQQLEPPPKEEFPLHMSVHLGPWLKIEKAVVRI